MKNDNKQWNFLLMPFIFIILVFLLLILIITPYSDTIALYTKAVTISTPVNPESKITSIFDSELSNKVKEENEKSKNKIPSSQIEYPKIGVEYGVVKLDKLNTVSRLIYGDTDADLRNGVGHFNGSVFPGEEGTTLIGGHNTASFSDLVKSDIGDTITIKTNYGHYKYKINNKEIKKYDDKTAIQTLYEKTEENKLILYTCYPVNMIGLTDDRLFVYADLISGNMIDSLN